MPASTIVQLSEFAKDVRDGLAQRDQRILSPRYFYDDLGTALFEAITFLPEYGLTRADERLLSAHSARICELTGPVDSIAELGSGSGRKTRCILQAFGPGVAYSPIDISPAALALCESQLSDLATVRTVCGDWMEGLDRIASARHGDRPLLLLFLGSSVGNLQRQDLEPFFVQIQAALKSGDYFLLGADLVKDVEKMIAAYDDPVGVTAAFNLNLLARINRELNADFDLRSFTHEVRWNDDQHRIEMHLLSCRGQSVTIRDLDRTFEFSAGETIWTESSHKFTVDELAGLASRTGFETVQTWTDREWPFAEVLWRRR